MSSKYHLSFHSKQSNLLAHSSFETFSGSAYRDLGSTRLKTLQPKVHESVVHLWQKWQCSQIHRVKIYQQFIVSNWPMLSLDPGMLLNNGTH